MHMTRNLNDPLLVLARGLSFVLLTLAGLAALAFAACLPFALFDPELVVTFLLRRDTYEVPPGTVAALAGLLGLGLLTLVGAVYFLKQLLDIIGSVAAGDPFVPANADRLGRMGWTVLAIQVLAVPLGLVQFRLQNLLQPDEPILALSFADNGLVLALVLFILARVFRHGTAMREDLEGTV
jgi:hypothetical protein